MSSTHDMYEELAVGHALSALEPEDEQVFLAHLLGCAKCERAVTEHAETLAHFAYGAASVEPPPSILEGIRAGVAASGTAGSFPAPASLDAARTRRRDRTVRWTTAVVGAAAALVMVAALVFVNQNLKSKEHAASVNAAGLREAVNTLLVSGSRKIDLVGENGSKAVAVVNGSTVSLVVSGVAANDTRNSIYVLWQKSRFGDVREVGSFDVTSSKLAIVNGLHLASSASDVQSFIVTREKGRTAPVMSTQPAVVAGDA